MGLTLPSPAYLAGLLLFGVIGYVAFSYGQKRALRTTKWLGVSLMLYPYAVDETWLLYALGSVLCAALYVWREKN